MASVPGSEFDRAALSALLGDRVEVGSRVTDLLRREIFVEAQGTQHQSLLFRHALMQEAAYSTILRKTRRELHHQVADELIESDPEAVQEIARHLVEAEDTDAAFPFFIEAGSRAIRSMALADAIRFYTMALENLPPDADPELVVTAHDGLGEAHSRVPDLSQSASAYQRLYEYGEDTRRPSAQVTALNRLGIATASLAGDLPKAMEYLDDAKRLAEESGDDFGLTEYHMNACFVASLRGDIEEAVVHDEETVRLAESQGVDRIRIEGMVRRADNYLSLLDFERGIPALEDALQAAEEAGAEEALAVLHMTGVSVLRLREADFRGALEAIVPAQETLARYASFYTSMAQVWTAQILRELGDLEAALGRLVDGRRVAERSHLSFFSAFANAGMAHVYGELRVTEAIPALRSAALEGLATPLGEFMASSVWADLGSASLLSGDPAQAAEDYQRGLDVSSATRFWERPRLLVGRTLALAASGDVASARGELAAAEAYIAEKDLRTYDAVIPFVQGSVLELDGNIEQAAAALGEAHTQAMSTGQRLLLIRINAARSRLALAAGNGEEAAAHAETARSAVETIAESIVDADLRQSFETGWSERFGRLAAET
jgi:tetratricopeptide (TPR) repeat protein